MRSTSSITRAAHSSASRRASGGVVPAWLSVAYHAAAVKLGTFVPLGTGMIDMDRIFGALNAAGYDGWVIVEQDAPDEPLAAAMQSRTLLRERFGY